jgi:hypothetical protein
MAFRIQSAQTEFYIISDGKETDGSVVATIPKKDFNPSTTVRILVHVLNPLTMVAWQIVKIDPPIGPVPIVGVVQSTKVPDLYVGYKSVG